MKVRRILMTLLVALLGASSLAIVSGSTPPALGQGEPSMTISTTSGLSGTNIGVTGQGCFLPDGVTGADGLLFQLIAPDGSAAASETLLVERDGTWDTTFHVPVDVPPGTYSVRGTCIAPMYEDLGIITAGTFEVTGRGTETNPEREPATPRFPSQIEPYPTYDGQSTCSPAAKPGMIAFRDMVMQAYPGTASYGISRECSIGGTSEHKEGRAWDWANDANTAAGRRRVNNLMSWLFRTDQYGHRHAMARRLGIMYIIWNRKIFRMYRANEGWTSYTGSNPHTDHVHFSLTRKGANKRTSFWTLRMDGPPLENPPKTKKPANFDWTTRSVPPDVDHVQTGDFDGNGKVDILWYGRGAKGEEIWWGRKGRGFVHEPIKANGRLRPMAGDFDGDGRDDIFWYVPGSGQDHIWWGRPGRQFDRQKITVNPTYAHSMVGDFDGDGREDIFWHGPGGKPDKIWFGRADRRFVGKATTVDGTSYTPAVGDFDGDGRDDVFWYAPGTANDFLWHGRRDRTFDSSDRTVNGQRRPIIGDFNPNRRDDIFWYAPGDTVDKFWWGRPDRTFRGGKVPNVTGEFDLAFADDFDEDGDADVVWYSASGTGFFWWTK